MILGLSQCWAEILEVLNANKDLSNLFRKSKAGLLGAGLPLAALYAIRNFLRCGTDI
jgi:hypothetical protein